MKEDLLSAARRMVRFFTIDMEKGGLMTVDTQQACETLRLQVNMEMERRKNEQKVIAETPDADGGL